MPTMIRRDAAAERALRLSLPPLSVQVFDAHYAAQEIEGAVGYRYGYASTKEVQAARALASMAQRLAGNMQAGPLARLLSLAARRYAARMEGRDRMIPRSVWRDGAEEIDLLLSLVQR